MQSQMSRIKFCMNGMMIWLDIIVKDRRMSSVHLQRHDEYLYVYLHVYRDKR